MANSTMENIRKNIAFYRNQCGFTQEILSELSSISCDYLSEIERGKKVPSIKRLILISDALNIETYKLLMEYKPASC